MAEPTGREGRPSPTSTTNERNGGNAFGLDPAQIASNLEPFFVASSRFIENWRRASEELLEFGKTRFGRHLEVSRKVARSGSLEEAIELQAEHARATMQDYIAETSKLAEIGSRTISDTFEVWRAERQQVRRMGQEMAEKAKQTTSDALSNRKFAAE